MSQSIQIPNFATKNIKEHSQLRDAVIPGATSVILLSNKDIAEDDYILIGQFGSKTAELRTVASTSGATVAMVAALSYDHVINDQAVTLFGNQIVIYKAPNTNGLQPADNTFVPLTPIAIDTNDNQTQYTDLDGSEDDWYKYTYKNENTGSETPLEDSIAVRGGGVGQYVSISSIRDSAGFKNNRNITDTLIDEKRQAAQAEVNGALYGVYPLPFVRPINAMIENITRMIAVKYLYIDQYDVWDRDPRISARIKLAEQQLQDLKSGQLVLVDSNGSSIAIPPGDGGSSGNVDLGTSGWPNRTTASLPPTAEGAGDNMFKRSDIDGYNGRKY